MIRTPLTRRKPIGQRSAILKSTKPRERKCAACAERFHPQRPMQKVCSPACAVIQGRRETDKQDRKEMRERKAKLKTRSDWIKEAQCSFNRYVRLRAIRWGHACISSGAPLPREGLGGGFDCGHFRSIGSAPHLRFNLNNAWGQSKKDNRYGAGRHDAYRRGLIERIGIEAVERLEDNNMTRKFTIEYLQRLKKIFDKKAKKLADIL